MNLHKSLGWADKRTCNLVILPIQSNFTQESFLIVICMYLYACCIQKKVTYDLKELFLQVNVTDKKRCLENSLQINYRKLFFFECCAGISMSWQKKDKIFLSEVWIKKAEGCYKSSTQEKSMCLGFFVSFGHFSDGHLT